MYLKKALSFVSETDEINWNYFVHEVTHAVTADNKLINYRLILSLSIKKNEIKFINICILKIKMIH